MKIDYYKALGIFNVNYFYLCHL